MASTDIEHIFRLTRVHCIPSSELYDIFLFPELSNISCLGKIESYENTMLEYMKLTDKIPLKYNCKDYTENLVYFSKKGK